ncbi:MAG: response regulator transcription factor [Cyclobacteriaceae bacterium]|nr:response regulator transcription factor [Cyclobacteriaceae bacterium]
MDKINVLLVDDEYLALNLLEGYVSQVPQLQLVGKVKTPMQAIDVLQQQSVHLLFLDIQMPIFSGNHFLRSLQQAPITIFTTAFSEHAVEAFELGAIDYLLKPFSFERFMQAVNKAINIMAQRESLAAGPDAERLNNFLIAKADGKTYKIAFEEILFIEGLKEYVKIVTTHKTYITLETFKNLELLLPSPAFLRVHKSFMVARDRVQALNGGMLEIGKASIPMSRERKDELVKIIFNV